MGIQTICDRCKKVITTDSREHWRVEAEAFLTLCRWLGADAELYLESE